MTERENKPFQFSLRSLLAFVAIIAIAIVAIRLFATILSTPDDAYSMWGVGNLVLDYMESNDGAWPPSWDELEMLCEEKHDGYTMGGTVATLQQDVIIDFTFDPEEAMANITEDASSPSFRVIRLRNGSNAHFEGMEPNQRVFHFLKTDKFSRR